MHVRVRNGTRPTCTNPLPCHLQEEFERGNVVGLDLATGEPFDPTLAGVLDNYQVKKQVRAAAQLADCLGPSSSVAAPGLAEQIREQPG